MVEVNYVTQDSGVSAEINLPSNVSGELVWKGKTLGLHPGHQQIALCPKVRGLFRSGFVDLR